MPDDDGNTLLYATLTGHWDQNAGLRSRKQAHTRELEQRLLENPAPNPDWAEPTPGTEWVTGEDGAVDENGFYEDADASRKAYEAEMQEQQDKIRDERTAILKELDEINRQLALGSDGTFHSEAAELKTNKKFLCFSGLTQFTQYCVQLTQYCNGRRVNRTLQMMVKPSGNAGAVGEREMEALWHRICWLPLQSAHMQLREGFTGEGDEGAQGKIRSGASPGLSALRSPQSAAARPGTASAFPMSPAATPGQQGTPGAVSAFPEADYPMMDGFDDGGHEMVERPLEKTCNPASYVFIEALGETSATITWSAYDAEQEEAAAQRVVETRIHDGDDEKEEECERWSRKLADLRATRAAFEALQKKAPSLDYVIKLWRLGRDPPKEGAQAPKWWVCEAIEPEGEGGGASEHDAQVSGEAEAGNPAAAAGAAAEHNDAAPAPDGDPSNEATLRQAERVKREVVSELNTSQYSFVVGGLVAGGHYAIKVACLHSAATDDDTGVTVFSEVTHFQTSAQPSCDVSSLQRNPENVREFFVKPGPVPLAVKEAGLGSVDALLPRHLFRCYPSVSYQIRLKGARDNLKYVNLQRKDVVTVSKVVDGEEEVEELGFRVDAFEAGTFTEISIRVNLPGKVGFEATLSHYSGWSDPVYIASRYCAVNVLDIGKGDISFGWEIEEQLRRACLSEASIFTAIFAVTSATHSVISWMPQPAKDGDRGSSGMHTVTGLPVERYQIRIIITEVCGRNGTAAAICAEWSWADRFAAVALVNRFDPILDRVGERDVSLFCVQQESDAAALDIGQAPAATTVRLCESLARFREKASAMTEETEQDARDISKFEVRVLNLTRVSSDSQTRMFVPNAMLAGQVVNLEPSTEYSIAIRPQVVGGSRHHWGQWSSTLRFRTLDTLKISVLTIGEDCFELNTCRPYPYPQMRPALCQGDHVARLKRDQQREVNNADLPAYKKVAQVTDVAKMGDHDVFAYIDAVYDFHQEYRLDLADDLDQSGSAEPPPPPKIHEGRTGTVRRYYSLRSGWRYTVTAVIEKSAPKALNQGAAAGAALPPPPVEAQSNTIAVWTAPPLTIRIGDVAETSCEVTYSRARESLVEIEHTVPDPQVTPAETLQLDDDAVTSLQIRIVPAFDKAQHAVEFHDPVVPLIATAQGDESLAERAVAWKDVTEHNEFKGAATSMEPESDLYPPFFERSCDLGMIPLETGGRFGPPCHIANMLPGHLCRFKVTGLSPDVRYGVQVRRIISDRYRGQWSGMFEIITQSKIMMRLVSATETYATVAWGRKGNAFSEEATAAAELNVPFYGPVGEVVQWQVAIVGELPMKISQDTPAFSLAPRQTAQREYAVIVPPKDASLTFPYLVANKDYAVRVRSMQSARGGGGLSGDRQWSEWSNTVEFSTRPPLVLTVRNVGCTMCALECYRDGAEPAVPPERYDVIVFDAQDHGWVQFQTSNDGSLMPVQSTPPITTSEHMNPTDFKTHSVVRGLTPGRQYVALAGVESARLPDGAAGVMVGRWGVMATFTAQDPPQAAICSVGEEHAVLEVVRRQRDGAAKFRVAVNGVLAVASMTLAPDEPVKISLEGLVLNTSYVVRISEQLQTVKRDASVSRWGRWIDLLTFSTKPQRPSVAVLYECREEYVSFFWRLETEADIGGAAPPSQPASFAAPESDPGTPAESAATGATGTDGPFASSTADGDVEAPERGDSGSQAAGSAAADEPAPETAPLPVAELFGPGTSQGRRMSAARAAAPPPAMEVSAFRVYAERHLACAFECTEGSAAAERQQEECGRVVNMAARHETVDEASLPVRSTYPLLATDCTFAVEVAKMRRRRTSAAEEDAEGEAEVEISEFRKVCEVPTPFVRVKLREGGGAENYCFRVSSARMSALGKLASRVSPIFAFLQPRPPNPPLHVTVRDVLHTSALLEWDAPVDVSLHNQVVYGVWLLRAAPDEEWHEVARVRTTAYFLTGLHIASTYKVKLRCFSTFGRGAPSSAVKFSTQQRVDVPVDATTSFATGCEGLNDPRAVLRGFDYKWVYPNPTATDATPLPFHTPFHLYRGSVPQQHTATERGRWAASCTVPHFGASAFASPGAARYAVSLDLLSMEHPPVEAPRRGTLPPRPTSAGPPAPVAPLAPLPPPTLRPSSAAGGRPLSRLSVNNKR
eukprot:TRINITY_DN2737_c0_g4_i2.p1 TRINITY_DN2737_c0_g4~~TRINITY_DN2737_c0_g4_i2.p1  ORF type:complete len:2517 (+),score=851.73 TRINITY_DN2737_c0_g4_i2:1099-7551(+)